MSNVVTREEFEYSIVSEYGDYANKIANALKLTEVKEYELTKFKLASICVEAIRHYFSRYNGNTAHTDDANGLKKAEIENLVEIFNFILNTNYWYEFPNDVV